MRPACRTALALCLLAAPALAQEELSGPPLPPPLPPPLVPQQTAGTRVHLDAKVPDAELYDVTAATSVCRAPCGIWLTAGPEHSFQIRAPEGIESSEFSLDEPKGDISVTFTPRDTGRYALGKGLMVAGVVIAGIGYISAVAWLVVELVANMFVALLGGLFGGTGGGGWLGAFELLYVAAGGVGVGGILLGIGIPNMVSARERLSVDAFEPPLTSRP